MCRILKIGLGFGLLLLLAACGGSQPSPNIRFEPVSLSFMADTGKGKDITVTLRNTGTKATLYEIIPPSEEIYSSGQNVFIDVDPDLLQGSLGANATQTLKLYAECPVAEGVYTQSLKLKWGSQTLNLPVQATCNPAPLEPVVAEHTHIASAQDLEGLESYDPATGIFVFSGSSTYAQNLKKDDVIVGPPAANAPDGFLRSVDSTSADGGKIRVQTSEAGIADAMTQGEVSIQAAADFPDTPQSGVTAQTIRGASKKLLQYSFDRAIFSDQFRVSGSVSLAATTVFQFKFKVIQKTKRIFGIKIKIPVGISAYVKAGAGLQQEMNLRFNTPYYFKYADSTTLSFAHWQAGRIVFSIGPVPVVLVPVFDLGLTAGVDMGAMLDISAGEQISFTTGIEFNGALKPYFDHTFTETHKVAELTGVANGRITLDAGLTLALYGVAGPYVKVSLGPQFQATATQRELNWMLGGCASAAGGTQSAIPVGVIKILSFKIPINIPKVGGTFFERCVTWDSGRTVSNQNPVVSLNTGDGNLNQLPGQRFAVVAQASDPDGDPMTYAWDPAPLDQSGLQAGYFLRSPGVHPITFTATDSYGGKAMASQVVNIPNLPPRAKIAVITQPPFHGSGITFSGTATDPNEGTGSEDGTLPCDRLKWSTDNVGAEFAVNGCNNTIYFSGTGSKTVTLTATDPQGLTDNTSISVMILPGE